MIIFAKKTSPDAKRLSQANTGINIAIIYRPVNRSFGQ